MSSRARISLILLFVVLVGGSVSAVACGSSKKAATPTPAAATKAPPATATPGMTMTPTTIIPTATAGPSPTAATGTSVTIRDFQFTPANITIKVGDTVTWTNDGPSVHTVTADDGSFDSGDLSVGKTFSHRFQTAGSFGYHCSIHPFMTATVIVQSGSSATSPGY
jgi:plastocyanin